ncbi:MAG: aspartate aminotransferase family protein [Rhodospirillales bacterium]|nr:aspartate aminotransferase family protein [Rhodospirillales bacterium]
MADFRFSNTHAEWMARDAKSVMGWRYDPPIVFRGGKGTKIFDVDGNEYYDLTSGMMSQTLGHAHPEIVEAIREQAELLCHESSWYSNPWLIEFAELLGSTLPGNLSVMDFAVTGSEANEVAFRMAIAKSGKFDIVSVIRGLHGGNLAVESVTTVGGARKHSLGPLLMPSRAAAILPPLCYRCLVNLTYPGCDIGCLKTSEQLMEFTTTKSVAAIIAETVPVSGGMIVPPKEWLPRLAMLARRWDAMLVLDEAQLAPARTGKMWGFQHYDVVPDILTFGKGVSAGFAICGAITTPEIAAEVRGKCGLPWAGTYTGDPFPAAIALKQLQIVIRDGLAERSGRMGAHLRARLEEEILPFGIIGDIRGLGLYQMLDVVEDKRGKNPDPAGAERIRYNLMMEGVATIAVRNMVRIVPPLIITEAEIEDVVGRMRTAVKQAEAGYPRDVDFSRSSSLAAEAPVAAE